MSADKRLVHLSKFMSLILRHSPEKFGIILDPEGYTPIDELLGAIQEKRPKTTREDIIQVVETNEPEKQRFSIIENDIRANYGHSLADRIGHKEATPPNVLFHGTYEKAVATIKEEGLRPMARQYVHLTTDRLIAERVGGRRGKPMILKISSGQAHDDGIVFYRANDTFWLVDQLPAQYIKSPE